MAVNRTEDTMKQTKLVKKLLKKHVNTENEIKGKEYEDTLSDA
jgi:hypothetical protein